MTLSDALKVEPILDKFCESDTGLIAIGKHDHDALREALLEAYERGVQDRLALKEEILSALEGEKREHNKHPAGQNSFQFGFNAALTKAQEIIRNKIE